jgi:hypothetical protein
MRPLIDKMLLAGIQLVAMAVLYGTAEEAHWQLAIDKLQVLR